MVDVRRAYRRWTLRRLALLAPVFAVTIACVAWLGLFAPMPSWVRAISTAVSGAGAALIAQQLILALSCGRRPARERRAELSAYQGLSLLTLAVLAALLAVPLLFDESPVPAADHPVGRLRPLPFRPPAPLFFETSAEEVVATPPDVPPRLTLVERDAEPAPIPEPAPAREVDATPETEFPGLDLTDWTLAPPLDTARIERLGLPESARQGEPPRATLSVFMPDLDGYGRGGSLEILSEIPVHEDAALRAGYFVALFARDESFPEGEPELAWQRLTIDVAYQVAGRTRHAAFDLLLSAGLSVDSVQTHDAPTEISEEPRLSPYLGVEIGRWEAGSWGLLASLKHSFPFDLTGASSGVTDIAVRVRMDLSEGVSVELGYRYIILEMADYSDAFRLGGYEKELEVTMSGPQLGLEFRF